MIPGIEIPASTYAIALCGAFALGISKAGIPGLALVNVIIMAEFFQKESVGIVLPLLVVCDLIIYPLYRRYASWKLVWPLLVPCLVGVLGGYLVLKQIDDATTKVVIGWIILGLLVLQILRNRTGEMLRHLPDSRCFLIGSSLVIGVSTTVANAAGPAYSVWALVKGLSKEDFLGIGARLFLLLNLIKIPFNAEIGIINSRTLLLDAALLPAILLGIAIGKPVVQRIPQKPFEWLLLVLSAVGAGWLILS